MPKNSPCLSPILPPHLAVIYPHSSPPFYLSQKIKIWAEMGVNMWPNKECGGNWEEFFFFFIRNPSVRRLSFAQLILFSGQIKKNGWLMDGFLLKRKRTGTLSLSLSSLLSERKPSPRKRERDSVLFIFPPSLFGHFSFRLSLPTLFQPILCFRAERRIGRRRE